MERDASPSPAPPNRPTTIGFVVLPAAVGALVLLAGAQGAISALAPGNPDGSASGLRGAVAPIAVGLVLLLVAVAVTRRSRSGRLLGQVAAVLAVIAGTAFFVSEISYLSQGGLSAAFAGPFMVMALIWTAAWAAYGWRISKARSAFSNAWQPTDRRVGVVLSALVLAAGGAWLSLGTAESQASADYEAAYLRAQALIDATTFEVAVVSATLDQAPGGDQERVVEDLVLELTLRSAEAYPLDDVPALCLADQATYDDPGYKPGVICWSTPGSAIVLEGQLPHLTVPVATTFRLSLTRGPSQCGFGAGRWVAALTLSPRTLPVETDVISPWPRSFTIDAPFDVPVDSRGGASPPVTTGSGPDCLGVSP